MSSLENIKISAANVEKMAHAENATPLLEVKCFFKRLYVFIF